MTPATLPAALQQTLSALPMGVRCRPAQASDESLLREVFASTRAQDLALLGMAPVVLSTPVQMQFEAQRRHYMRAHVGLHQAMTRPVIDSEKRYEQA